MIVVEFFVFYAKQEKFGKLALRGLRKVTGEFALLCLGYNIERAKNLLGFEKMMEIIAGV